MQFRTHLSKIFYATLGHLPKMQFALGVFASFVAGLLFFILVTPENAWMWTSLCAFATGTGFVFAFNKVQGRVKKLLSTVFVISFFLASAFCFQYGTTRRIIRSLPEKLDVAAVYLLSTSSTDIGPFPNYNFWLFEQINWLESEAQRTKMANYRIIGILSHPLNVSTPEFDWTIRSAFGFKISATHGWRVLKVSRDSLLCSPLRRNKSSDQPLDSITIEGQECDHGDRIFVVARISGSPEAPIQELVTNTEFFVTSINERRK